MSKLCRCAKESRHVAGNSAQYSQNAPDCAHTCWMLHSPAEFFQELDKQAMRLAHQAEAMHVDGQQAFDNELGDSNVEEDREGKDYRQPEGFKKYYIDDDCIDVACGLVWAHVRPELCKSEQAHKTIELCKLGHYTESELVDQCISARVDSIYGGSVRALSLQCAAMPDFGLQSLQCNLCAPLDSTNQACDCKESISHTQVICLTAYLCCTDCSPTSLARYCESVQVPQVPHAMQSRA